MDKQNIKKTEKEKALSEVRQKFTEHLDRKGLRKTPERLAILELIHKNKGHFDVDNIEELLKEKCRVSRATIYNTLELLLECNLVIRHQFNNSQAKYEKTTDNNHHHLICANCGSIKEFGDDSITKLIHHKPLRGFKATHYSLYIYGLCNKCSKEI